jgi:HD-GYP domain-containing protein (c-di-GMP phosphodiesterase class II)
MQELNQTQIAQRLDQLTELSVELGSSHDTDTLLERILVVAKSMTNADGGTLYRPSEDKRFLDFTILLNDTLNTRQGGATGDPITAPGVPLFDESGAKNLASVAAYAAHFGLSVNIEDVYKADVFNFSGMVKFDQLRNYHSQSFLTVPMSDHEGELVGVLQLINAKDADTGEIRAFTPTDQRFIEALAAQAAVAPYTGRHCQFVPELTMMLAEAVHNTETGPMADFRMNDADRKELWLAGLLHDCGKITTPVHVVDKATKLETIFDRIAVVDTRFEVLLRDAEIAALRRKLEAGADQAAIAAIDAELAEQQAALRAERDFIRVANVGGEGMKPEDQDRVREIGKRSWVGPDGAGQPFFSDNELMNLTIKFGTLTDSERKEINNHISMTIKMLEALPWPKHLKNVPEYAGGHHERMDGKGYPRGLTKDQMSVQARLMAIADIFEALTAKDRPYKKGKMLSESLRILGNFSLNGHIDPDLFDIFIRSKIYMEFAHKNMDEKQIDAIDEAKIPGYTP